MVAFDTNYLIRHLIQDDQKQSNTVLEILETELGEGRTILLFDIVLCEAVWILNSVYNAKRKDVLVALNGLLEESCFEFENAERIKSAVSRFEKGKIDFSDCLLIENSQKYDRKLLTFDKKLLKEIP